MCAIVACRRVRARQIARVPVPRQTALLAKNRVHGCDRGGQAGLPLPSGPAATDAGSAPVAGRGDRWADKTARILGEGSALPRNAGRGGGRWRARWSIV